MSDIAQISLRSPRNPIVQKSPSLSAGKLSSATWTSKKNRLSAKLEPSDWSEDERLENAGMPSKVAELSSRMTAQGSRINVGVAQRALQSALLALANSSESVELPAEVMLWAISCFDFARGLET